MANNDIKNEIPRPTFRVLWEQNGSTKMLTSQSRSLHANINEVPMASHELDVQVTREVVIHPSSECDSLHVSDATAIINTSGESAFHSHSVGEEAEEHIDQIITEISSSDCANKKGRKVKRERIQRCTTPDFSDTSPKRLKIKKERDPDTLPAVRKKFSRNWFHLPEFSKWLEESPIPGYAFCNVCRKDLLPGKSELLKHASTAKHKRKMEAIGHGTKDDPITQRVVDLRSDTVTTPNREMREAMRDAIVGDSAYGEDPTVTALENKIAKLLGKEAGLFVPSGTMANLISVLTHCWSRGSLVILGDQSFMYRSSQGSMSEIGSVSQKVVHNLPDGTFELSELKNILKTHGPGWPTTTLVCIENTHTMMGGKAVPLEWLNNLGELCAEYGIPIHLDGARLINASAALGSSPFKLSVHCASVSFCLNKGLGAPGGCVLAGSTDFIDRAALARKALGGTIHQAGILAAAGLYGLNNLVSRIAKDHSNARSMAKAVCALNSSAVTVDVNCVQTNVVHLICDNIRVNPEQLCDRLARVVQEEAMELHEGIIVKCEPIQPNIVRLMTHGDLLMEDIRAAVRKLQHVITEYDNFFVIEYVN